MILFGVRGRKKFGFLNKNDVWKPPWCDFLEKIKVSKARTSPRPRGYVAKRENLERVRGQGVPTRYGYEGYVAKRRHGQRVER